MSEPIETSSATKTTEQTAPTTTQTEEVVPEPQPAAVPFVPEQEETLRNNKPTKTTQIEEPTKSTEIEDVPQPKEGSKPEVKATGVAWAESNEADDEPEINSTSTTNTSISTKRPQEDEGPNPLGSDLKRTKSDPESRTKEEKEEEKEEPSTKKKVIFGATTKFGAQAFSHTKSSSNVFSSLPSSIDGKTTDTIDVNKKDEEKEAPMKTTFGSVFGSKSTFGNAFQSAISKKSIFDTISRPSIESLSSTSTTKDTKENIDNKDTKQDTTTAPPKNVKLPKETEVSTGEENESQLFTCRAKLYSLNLKDVKSGWKERGLGSLHVNKSKNLSLIPNRVIMRSNGLMNVILNVKIEKAMQLSKGFEGSLQSQKFITFNGVGDDNEVVRFAVKVGKEELASELFDVIDDLMETDV